MELTQLSQPTRQWVISLRNQLKKIEDFTNVAQAHLSNTRTTLIIELGQRLSNKERQNRLNVLMFLLGRAVGTQNDVSYEEHLALLDALTKTPDSMECIHEIEQLIEAEPDIPGGPILIIEYTSKTRHLLSARLAYERGVLVPGKGLQVTCFDCGEPIDGLGDLHEGFITRGQVAKSDTKNKIFHRLNCAHRHNECPDGKHKHTPGTGGDETLLRFTKYMLEWEEESRLRKYLEGAAREWPVIGQEALNRFNTNVAVLAMQNAPEGMIVTHMTERDEHGNG